MHDWVQSKPWRETNARCVRCNARCNARCARCVSLMYRRARSGNCFGGDNSFRAPQPPPGRCPGSDPDPPPPREVQSVEEVWSTFGPTWRRRRWKPFFGIRWGVTIVFTLRVCAQNAQNLMRNSNMHAKQENVFHRCPSSPPPVLPPPQSLRAGTGPPVGKFFFSKTPHMCVQNDQRDKGIILRYVCWGTRDPPTGAPPPRVQKVRAGCWCQV